MVNQGDIFYINLTPSQGHEERAQRPVIALSNDLVTKISGMTIIAPISTTGRDYPMYYTLRSPKKIRGKAMLDQTRALDLKARNITDDKVIDRVSQAELEDILYHYRLLFTPDEEGKEEKAGTSIQESKPKVQFKIKG